MEQDASVQLRRLVFFVPQTPDLFLVAWTSKASRAAGTAAGHFIAQVVAVIALVLAVGGLALIVGAVLWA
jgi:hypothetical protein